MVFTTWGVELRPEIANKHGYNINPIAAYKLGYKPYIALPLLYIHL